MSLPSLRNYVAAGLLLAGPLLAGAVAALADPFPAAVEPLRDFDGAGFIQVDLPSTPDNANGVKLMIGYRQQFVRPDRTMIDVEVSGVRQRTLVQGNVERTFSPGTGYLIERTYRNIEALPEDPIAVRRMSIIAFSQALREIQSAKVLPTEPLDETEKKAKARLEELLTLRKLLLQSKDEKDLSRAQDAAMESARVRDLVEQIPLFKSHPCWVVEIPNKDLSQTLLARGLMGDEAKQLLQGGKTLLWVTKAQGLPVRMETTSSEGHVAVYFCFRTVKINDGAQANEVVLGAPRSWRMFTAMADVRDPKWQDKMQESLQKQLDAYTREIQAAQKNQRNTFQEPQEIRFPGKKRKK